MPIFRRQFLKRAAAVAASAALPVRLPRLFAQEATAGVPASTLAADPRRPQFHLLPARNWMNDPNGPIFFKGKYHMFFQYNPNAAVWGDMHWAHAVSPDMIHWRHLPVALAPTPGGPDADGCFSGTAILDKGVPTFIYTGVAKAPPGEATLRDGNSILKETQLLATSSDPELRTWTKRAQPIIPKPPEGMQVTGFRDPAPWHEPRFGDDVWYMAVGSGEQHKGGAILLYKSTGLTNWKYEHIVARNDAAAAKGTQSDAANPVDSGDMWECPDLFPLGDRHVLIYSTQGKVFWQTGELDPQAMLFHPRQSGLLDYGSFYAPKTQLDKAHNRILWGWIPETRPVAEYSPSGWAGLMSLPRTLTLSSTGRLHIAPPAGLEKLRQHEQAMQLAPVKSGSTELISSVRLKGACGEILCVVKAEPEPFSIDLLVPVDPKDAAVVATQPSLLSIRYSRANPKELIVDQQRIPVEFAAASRWNSASISTAQSSNYSPPARRPSPSASTTPARLRQK